MQDVLTYNRPIVEILLLQLGITVDTTSKLVFCRNRCRNTNYQFVKASDVYDHIITKHQSLAHLLTGWDATRVTHTLHCMGAKIGEEALVYVETIGQDALPRISCAELPQDGYDWKQCNYFCVSEDTRRAHKFRVHSDMVNVHPANLFYQCKVQRINAASPYFKVRTDNVEVQQIREALHQLEVLQEALQRCILQHRHILAQYSPQ